MSSGSGQWDIPKLRIALETVISGEKTIEAFEEVDRNAAIPCCAAISTKLQACCSRVSKVVG